MCRSIPLCCYTTTRLLLAASHCPARSHLSAIITTAAAPCPRLPPSLLSLNFQLLYRYHYHQHHHRNSPALTFSLSLSRLVHASFDVANRLPFHLSSPPAPRCLYSLFHSHAPSGWTPDTTIHQNIYHTHTRLTRFDIHHPRTSHTHAPLRPDITHPHQTITTETTLDTTLDAQ